MSAFGRYIETVMRLYMADFTLFGYTFSFWDVIIWVILAGILVKFIVSVFSG